MRTILCLLMVVVVPLVLFCRADGAEEWRNNRIGISEVPPPPFSPMSASVERNSAKITCWGRVYTLGATGLPVQIRSKDADLLAAPVRLVTESEGRKVEWMSTGMRLVKNSQVQVVLVGQAESKIGKLDWKCTAEYDGLLRYDLEIAPSPGVTVDKLELVFGVKPEHAALMWLPGQYPTDRHGRLRPQSGSANWYTWLGDLERGLAVFFRTDEAWDDPGRSDAWRLERRPGSVDHAWMFIKGSKALPKPWKYTFGIEATPVKKTPGGRKWLLASHLPVGPGNFVMPWAHPKTTKYFGYPEATDPEKYRRMVEWYHKQGIKVCPYVLLNVLSAGAPELAAHPEWTGDFLDSGQTGSGDVVEYGHDLRRPSPTADYIDWMVWKCDRFVRENNLDGLYHDFTMLMVLTDIPQGFGYMRDGKPVRCYPFFERRELYKRIFTMLKQYKKDAINIGHMSGDMYVPFLAFCDIIVNGEHVGSVAGWRKRVGLTSNTYQDLMTDDYLHSEVMGHNYGLTTIWLEQWGHLGIKQEVRFLLGLALLYDFSLWRTDGGSPHMRVYKAFREFGAMDAEFIPFWRAAEIVRGQTDEVRCSAYRKKDGGSMLVFFNRGKEAREMTFTVDWAKLKTPGPVVVRDVLPGGWGELVDNEMPVKGDQLTVKVPAEDFRLLAVE